MRKLLLTTALVAALVGQAHAFDFRSAALDAPDLSGLATTNPRPLAGGLLDDGAPTVETKSTSKAVFYSIMLPGLGQYYLGEKTQAKVFFMIDAVIITSFIVFTVQGNLREDEYQEYARVFAGLTRTDHSDDYYGLLTSYDSSREYEDEIKGDGRLELYPDIDVATLNQYFVNNRVSDYEMWIWQSADHRRAYQERRAASKRADRRALYAVAAAIANRVASAFFAYRSAKRSKQEGSVQQTGFFIEFGAPQRHTSDGFQTGISVIRNF
jgi:hypothetical protein